MSDDSVLESEFDPIEVTGVELSVSDSEQEYFDAKTTTYTTYSGADVVVSIGNEMLGACSDISWVEDLEEGNIRGKIKFTLFNDAGQHLRDKILAKRYDAIEVTLKNEYGSKAGYLLLEPKFYERLGGASMDNIVLEEAYRFTAEKLEWLEVE